jgi:hypothetical protein
VDLRCEYAVDPLGVDSPNPRLFWKLEGEDRGQRQSARQILAASSLKNLAKDDGDLWDSGRVASDESTHIRYAGKELSSSQPVFWKVRVWDADGNASRWSEPASWTMGVLRETDWNAKWIAAADTNLPTIILRREIPVRSGLRHALVNVCGLGQYELSVNGKKVGDDWLSPGWTKYDKTCLYETHDITELLRQGNNAFGLLLGNGMYNVTGGGRFTKFRGSFGPLKAIAQIRLEYADGSVDVIGTDDRWRVAPGAITFCTIYGGEDFDARRFPRGWDSPGFDDSKWDTAKITGGPGGKLKGLSCAAPPIRSFEIHKPIATRSLPNGDVLFDLGQNASHVPRIRVSGPAGSRVRLLPSELLNDDGTVNQGSMGAGRRGTLWCEFTKATDREETWSPKFFYVGCRYFQVKFTNSSPDSVSLSPSDGERAGVRGLFTTNRGPFAKENFCVPRITSLSHPDFLLTLTTRSPAFASIASGVSVIDTVFAAKDVLFG